MGDPQIIYTNESLTKLVVYSDFTQTKVTTIHKYSIVYSRGLVTLIQVKKSCTLVYNHATSC